MAKNKCEILVVNDINNCNHLIKGQILAIKELKSTWSEFEKGIKKTDQKLPKTKVVKIKQSQQEIESLFAITKIEGQQLFYNKKTKEVEVWEQP